MKLFEDLKTGVLSNINSVYNNSGCMAVIRIPVNKRGKPVYTGPFSIK